MEFKEFLEEYISAKVIVNPYWLEYILCLISQGYIGEVWEEITETKINFGKLIEEEAYGLIWNESVNVFLPILKEMKKEELKKEELKNGN